MTSPAQKKKIFKTKTGKMCIPWEGDKPVGMAGENQDPNKASFMELPCSTGPLSQVHA